MTVKRYRVILPVSYIDAVPHLEEMLEKAKKAGSRNLTKIESMPWRERLFYGQDPFENPK